MSIAKQPCGIITTGLCPNGLLPPPSPQAKEQTTTDLAKFAAGSVVRVLGDHERREFTIITRHYLWGKAGREYHYRLFHDCGNGRAEMTWKKESEIEGVGK